MKFALHRGLAPAVLLTGLLAAGGCGGSSGSGARVGVRSPDTGTSASYFYDDLAPYGYWVDYRDHGSCWVPVDVSSHWRPYEDGYWVWTDYGWTWVSYEPWGWATSHYGRWDYDVFHGWVWVPGTVWAPAWVAWHAGDDWVGWAPLPPDAVWQSSGGLRFHDVDIIPARRWCFVSRDRFSDSKLKSHVVSVARNEWLLERTKDVTRFEVREGRPVNRGVDVAFVERGGRSIRQVRLVDADSPDLRRGRKTRDRLEIYRPDLRDQIRSGPPPDKRGRAVDISERELERRRVKQRQQLDQDLRRGDANLRRQHERELRAAPAREAADIQERQARERRSFERQAYRERQWVEDLHRQRAATVEKDKAPPKREPPPPAKRGNSGRKQRG